MYLFPPLHVMVKQVKRHCAVLIMQRQSKQLCSYSMILALLYLKQPCSWNSCQPFVNYVKGNKSYNLNGMFISDSNTSN